MIIEGIKLIFFGFNKFFDIYIRESENQFVHLFWTFANLFGFLKIILELKSLVEFLIRNILWRDKLHEISPSKEMTIQTKYG